MSNNVYIKSRLRSWGYNTQEDSNRIESIILEELRLLLQEINNSNDKTVIFVTNEIGLGIIPEKKLARYFRDITGRVNREVASAANKMYLTISGVTIELKSGKDYKKHSALVNVLKDKN